MVIIELYKSHATHMKYIGGGNEEFSKSKTTKFFYFTRVPILNVQTCNCILGGDILYACAKFQSEMISLKTF